MRRPNNAKQPPIPNWSNDYPSWEDQIMPNNIPNWSNDLPAWEDQIMPHNPPCTCQEHIY
jgi:hypothetical protein